MIRFGRQDRQDRQDRALQKSLKGVTSVKGVKNVSLGANPLLTSRTPVWRSRLLVAGLALGFVLMAGRAAYVQVFGNDFFLRQGFADLFSVRCAEAQFQEEIVLRERHGRAGAFEAKILKLGHRFSVVRKAHKVHVTRALCRFR